jgi:V/A-type H+-transporting ATPase subunit E
MTEIQDNTQEFKLNAMLALIKKEKDSLFKELQDEYKSKIDKYEKSFNLELDDIRNKKIGEAKIKAKNLINAAKTKADFILKQEKLKNRNEFISFFFEALKKALINLNPKDKSYLYRKLYREASKMIDENFVVVCNPNDKDIVESIVKDAKIETDKSIEGGILLKSGDLKIWNTIDSYIEENKSEILALLTKEVGEL